MTAGIVLSPEQIEGFANRQVFSLAAARKQVLEIEQAVLQSPEVAALRRLAQALDEKIESYERYGAICEFEGAPMIHASHLEELRAAMERQP